MDALDVDDYEWGWHQSNPMVILDDGGDVVARVEGTDDRLARLIGLAPNLLRLARYAAERGEGDAEMAVEILACIPGEEALLWRLGYAVVNRKPSRDAYEAALRAGATP